MKSGLRLEMAIRAAEKDAIIITPPHSEAVEAVRQDFSTMTVEERRAISGWASWGTTPPRTWEGF